MSSPSAAAPRRSDSQITLLDLAAAPGEAPTEPAPGFADAHDTVIIALPRTAARAAAARAEAEVRAVAATLRPSPAMFYAVAGGTLLLLVGAMAILGR